MIKLPTSMIRYVDAFDAVIEGNFCVLRGGNPFNNEWNVALRLNPGDISPAKTGLVTLLVRPHAPTVVPTCKVSLASTVKIRIDRQAKGIITAGDSTADPMVHPRLIAAHIKLKYLEGTSSGGSGSLKPGLRH